VFYVYGEVPRGGAYRLEPNMTVMQAIAPRRASPRAASERAPEAAPRRRPTEGGRVRRQRQDTVRADDVIFVKETLVLGRQPMT